MSVLNKNDLKNTEKERALNCLFYGYQFFSDLISSYATQQTKPANPLLYGIIFKIVGLYDN